ncbi:MAG: hypothetical protein A2V98_11020 [Planctomycetes bacterium RBG_16_64_12]|nr:MAG: hypothetical protein A2V98_11020 [Planctomycetes bacterium RBG_16_64_12]
MTDFERRLQEAIERGQRTGEIRARVESEKTMSENELRRLHTQYRLELSEHIESCLKKLPRHFPGFEFESVVSDRGWGAAVSRDDVEVASGRRRTNYYSRLEMLIRPPGKYHVLDLTAKGTISNKELFNRNHFQRLVEADLASFTEMIDFWVLEYAELYAAKS